VVINHLSIYNGKKILTFDTHVGKRINSIFIKDLKKDGWIDGMGEVNRWRKKNKFHTHKRFEEGWMGSIGGGKRINSIPIKDLKKDRWSQLIFIICILSIHSTSILFLQYILSSLPI